MSREQRPLESDLINKKEAPEDPATRSQPMYGVVLGLPEEFGAEIAAMRERYSPLAARRIFPHVTLRMPFTTEDARALAPALEAVALRYLPVQLHAHGLGSFIAGDSRVLYVEVQRTERLFRLHEAVVHALPDVQNVYPNTESYHLDGWVPHITIADSLTEERLAEVQAELSDYSPRCDWEVRELLLVRSGTAGDGTLLWTTTRAFRTPA